MDTYFFERPDGTLLECTGRRLVKTSTERKEGPGARRWHHLQLLETDDGSLVLAIQYLTLCPGEEPAGYVWRGTATQLRDIANAFDAGERVPAPGAPSLRGSDPRAVADDLRQRFAQALPVILRRL
ncbi:MAG TPA: hypothetical protein IAB01_03220 [Candidatus Avidesulfovibrio excrementigallinarum]|nr:hypothetical protein [Candidatus Avidesulfovibrio excrementigallinarum]